jgi:unspecific monooxygenase
LEPASEQVRRWIETPIDFWEDCGRLYGPVAGLDLGSLGPVILLSDPELVRTVFQLTRDRFEVRQFNEHYRYVMGDNSLLVQDGEPHRRQRRLLTPLFRHETMVPHSEAIREIADRVLAQWQAGEAFSPRPFMQDVIFQVMVSLLLGDLSSITSRALVSAYRDAVLRQAGSWGPWRNFTRMQPHLRTLLDREIRARRENPTRPGIFTAIANAKTAEGDFLSSTECQDHVFSLMIAGVDTTAVALTWAMHWLCLDPAALARLRHEVRGLAADVPDRALLELPYLNAVFRETLRMYPIVPTPSGRKLTSELALGDWTFPQGTTLVPCTYLVHRREDLYPESHQFQPQRFLDRSYGSHEYFPFGGGARVCIGEALSAIEFKVVLAKILKDWDLFPTTGPVPPVRHGTLLAPADSFRLTVRRAAEMK